MDKQGLLTCSRYAISPNLLSYCGPKKSSNIIDHLNENVADSELKHIISEFETLYPYLQLIAKENTINDPFDNKVVEAYWLGNSLLNNIKNTDYLNFLKEKLILEKKIDKKSFLEIKTKIMSNYFLPQHTFHVFNIFKLSTKDASLKTIEAMDQCRINYGIVVQSQSSNLKTQNHNSKLKTKNTVLVKAKKLLIIDSKLVLDIPHIGEVFINYMGNKFIKNVKEGDSVSFHWGMMCDILTQRQVKNLQYYTKKAIDYYNENL